MADVFISYARTDQAVARRVARALESTGLDVWWDADLPAHRAYSDVIERNLADAKAVVVLWSKAAVASEWVRAEADFARNAGKLAQAQIDGSLPPMPFNQTQCADLKGWRGSSKHAGWAKLEASTKALVSGEEQPIRTSVRRSAWDRLQPYRWAALAVLALVLGAGIYLYAFGTAGEDRKPVLAVLPFKSLNAQDESLVAGMWEDTRTAIGRNPQLIVLGPNTAQQLANKGESAARKAADYLLQASVRTAGDRIRISTTLVRTKDGEQVWGQNFDRKLDDVFALQSQIASEIEGRIRGRLAERGGVMPQHIATSGEVYALYSDARAKIRRRESDQYVAAHEELERVVRMDPNFAPGWATLAAVIGQIPPSQRNWQLIEPAEVYARKAIDLAPNLAAAHGALALALNLKGPVARAEVERAVDLDPSDFEALTWLANMRVDQGDKKAALEAYGRAAEMEPLFWPAVLNMYGLLKDLGDDTGIQQLLERENRVGADYLGTSIKIDNAHDKGNLAEAANIGLAYWKTGRTEGRPAIGAVMGTVLLQLGFVDEALKLASGPDFAPALFRNDPKGLELMESHHIDAKTFFSLDPLTENAGRVYLLSGRGRTLANLYLSLKISPEEFLALQNQGSPQHFLLSAPFVVVALRQSGHAPEATALLSLAEAKAEEGIRGGKPVDSVMLARIYALEGRKEDAIPLLAVAISRGWIPEPPEMQVDLHYDPPLASLKGDPRYEKLRDQILGTVTRERAQVNLPLLRQVSSA